MSMKAYQHEARKMYAQKWTDNDPRTARKEKRCSGCQQVKSTEAFHINRCLFDGLAPRCKKCQEAYKRKHWAENADHCRAVSERAQSRWARLNPKGKLLRCARSRAKAKGLECTITLEDIIIPTHCPVLGLLLGPGSRGNTNSSPSLDRIDNTKGYIPGNVIVVSYRANSLKKDATPEELRKLSDFYNGR